jgi:MFS family permease
MALVQTHRRPIRRAGRALLIATCGFGVATICFGLSTWFPLSLAMLFLVGVFDNVSVVVRHSLVQLMTPDDMRGRVNAANQMFIGTSNEIGKVESGLAAWLLGPTVAVAGGGLAVLWVVDAIARRCKPLRDLGPLSQVDVMASTALPSEDEATRRVGVASGVR